MFFPQTVAPFFVATAMSGIRRSNWMVADANQYARSALATVGIMSFTHGTLSHSIQVEYMLPIERTCIWWPTVDDCECMHNTEATPVIGYRRCTVCSLLGKCSKGLSPLACCCTRTV